MLHGAKTLSESNKTLVNITLCHKNRPILTSS